MVFQSALFLLLGLILSTSAYKSYEDYKVYKVVPENSDVVAILKDFENMGYDFWTDDNGVGKDVRIMVSPDQDVYFNSRLASDGVVPEVVIPNVQKLMNDQMEPSTSRANSLGSLNWTRYYNLEEIHSWLDELPSLFPGVVEAVVIGQSLEGRDIKGVIIDLRSTREEVPLIGMIEGGIHSREWISPATVTWIIKEFLTSTDADVRFMAERFIWHIFPVVNPDGYVYTFTNDRMWRKNRNPANNVVCPNNNTDMGNGIDLNRNFNFLWMTVGASSNPCTQTYAGPTAGSELETQAISNYVMQLRNAGTLMYYLAFHSYSQMILIPFSHLNGENVLEVPNYADLYEIASRGAAKLSELYGTQYVYGTSSDILYDVSGSSMDWAKGVAEVPITYLFELRDTAQFGFLLPSAQIVPNNEEIMACLVEMEQTTRRLGYYSNANVFQSSFGVMVLGLVYLFAH